MPHARLRQDTIRSLDYVGAASEKAQCIYWDLALPGFGLRKFPNGRGSYVCAYRILKRKRLVDLGRCDTITLEQARRKARVYLGTAAEGKDPKSNVDEMRTSLTVKKLVELYIERHAKPKKKTWKTDEAVLNRLLIPRLGAHLAASITRADIALIHSEYGKDCPYGANGFVAVVRKMYNVGRRLGVLPEEMRNPGTEIERFPVHRRRRFVTPAEMPILAAAIDDDSNEFASHALWLLLLTGVRRSEILAAKWADIDWDNKTLYIGKTKNGEPVLAPLSRAAIARLKTIPRLKDNPYIICSAIPGKPLAYIDRMWRRVRKETGFKELRIHDLRRTVGSWLVRDGASLHLVGAVLNHRDQKTTAGYAYFQTEDRHKALDRHGKRIVRIASGQPVPTAKRASENAEVPTVRDSKRQRIQRITRRELYELVWSEPMTALAKRFGLSDRGLTKVCRRSDIPSPPRGYWAKVAVRGTYKRPDLPCRDDLDVKNITFRVNQSAGQRVPLEPSQRQSHPTFN